MRMRTWPVRAALLAVALLTLAACGGDGGGSGEMDKVTLQSKWVVQAQFAGYYAALDQGFYEDDLLGDDLGPAGSNPDVQVLVLGGKAEFGIDWLDSLLATRDQGQKIVNIAQVFTRSGMTEITWKDSGLDDITKLRGKKVGVWLGGNEHKLFAALNKNGIDPQQDVQIVKQPFTMDLFLNRDVDAAAAMTYNELAQVLETKNQSTGQLYQVGDLNVFKMSDLGTGALEDGVFVREDWIQDEDNQDIAKRFLKASFRGWLYCRDNPEDCLRIVLDNGPTLPEGHQRWQLNEVNALIWPAPKGIGVMEPQSWDITKQIALDGKVIKSPASDDSYRTDLAEDAVKELKDDGLDVNGESWQKETVTLTEGGR